MSARSRTASRAAANAAAAKQEFAEKAVEVPADVVETAEMISISPELATVWLEKNTANRQLNTNLVGRYVRDMRDGNWHFTGDAIKFDKNGILQDGQHRLYAILEHGKPVNMLVVKNLHPDSGDYMDLGRKRTLGDMLRREGVENYNMLAAISRLALSWMKGTFDTNRIQLSDQEIKHFYESNMGIMDQIATLAQRHYKRMRTAPRVVGAFMYMAVLAGNDIAEVDRFCSAIASYNTTGDGDPKAVYIQRIARAITNKEKLSTKYSIAMLVRCWNSYALHEEMFRLPAEFPKIPDIEKYIEKSDEGQE